MLKKIQQIPVTQKQLVIGGLAAAAIVIVVAVVLFTGGGNSRGEQVLARVDGSAITRQQLDTMIIRTLGYDRALQLSKAGRKKILESLVVGRAMARAVEDELSDQDRRRIKSEVDAYREQLLVKKYLRRHATPSAVTESAIKEYFNKHPERFGGTTLRRYRMIRGVKKVAPHQRAKLIAAMGKAGKRKNWKSLAASMRNQGFPVQYSNGTVDEKILHPKLYALFRGLKVKQTSAITFIDGNPYVVRVMSEKKQSPRPLSEVRNNIRKTLTLLKLKDATREAADNLMKSVEVEYNG